MLDPRGPWELMFFWIEIKCWIPAVIFFGYFCHFQKKSKADGAWGLNIFVILKKSRKPTERELNIHIATTGLDYGHENVKVKISCLRLTHK